MSLSYTHILLLLHSPLPLPSTLLFAMLSMCHFPTLYMALESGYYQLISIALHSSIRYTVLHHLNYNIKCIKYMKCLCFAFFHPLYTTLYVFYFIIQAMKRRISESKTLLRNMELQITVWRTELAESEIELVCAPGDALLVCTYIYILTTFYLPTVPISSEILIVIFDCGRL